MIASRRAFLLGATAAVVAAPAVAEAAPQWMPQPTMAWDLGVGTSVIYYGGARGGGKMHASFLEDARSFNAKPVPPGEMLGAIKRAIENMTTFGTSVTRTRRLDDDWIVIDEASVGEYHAIMGSKA